ncbi:MAG TPA: valine--tRNA ligase [Chitinophagaceae bacterium]|jgi:valyl-tRNA synthetase|nr:valine--tRNA ligase [Chitinophagaceae bacterium]
MELSKNFEPGSIEEKWTSHWKSKRYFNSTPDDRKAFTVVIPPPNVTGVLHMGHTLNETVQDILVRKARMSGFNACWVPGSDHASIATEAKVVQMLKEKGIDKNKIGREEFLKYAFEWKEKYGGIIYNQIERLGCSVDWDRVSFTMDDHYYKAVIEVFVDLYNKGLIYRGARMINWDPAAKTALSDEEVEYKELQGKLYYVKYFIADASGKPTKDFISIATQRPETIMGDTAVCVHPDDERYAYLKGKKVIVPLVNRVVPVIFDEYVDKEFGTGALKITPAHDINDYNLGLKHNLETIDTINADGTMSEAAQVFVGLDRFEARKKAIEKLKADGHLIKEEDYTTRLGFSQRTNAVVEPRISTQWFVKMKPLAEKALHAVLSGDIKIHPEERFLATYKYWLENVKDWCISRQLWWGQRIPAWYDDAGKFVVAGNEEEAKSKFKSQNLNLEGQLRQDEDVLDTWFSSWLWPIEVFNGITQPNNKDINYYYPTSVLVTGQDIIFFWVARMIMAGMEYMNEKPFSDVYFTGMVRDKQGRKMSKSLGNSPDLLYLIDRFGADAVRFGIMISSPAGNDLLFDDSSCDQGRNFNNKIWNALKLVRSWESRVQSSESKENFAIDWFENRLNDVRVEIKELYKDFRLSETLKTIYSLIWDDFCSWYLEWVKPGFEQPIDKKVYEKTVYFFEELMLMLHPFMPFVTEEIYHQLKERKTDDDLTIKQSEGRLYGDGLILLHGSLLKDFITGIRDARNKNQLKPKDPITIHVKERKSGMFLAIESILKKQVNAEEILYIDKPIADSIAVVVKNIRFYLKTKSAVNTSIQKDQLLKDLEYQKGFLLSVEKKLSNERFVQNARPEIIEIEKKKKADAEAKIKAIEESLASL